MDKEQVVYETLYNGMLSYIKHFKDNELGRINTELIPQDIESTKYVGIRQEIIKDILSRLIRDIESIPWEEMIEDKLEKENEYE